MQNVKTEETYDEEFKREEFKRLVSELDEVGRVNLLEFARKLQEANTAV